MNTDADFLAAILDRPDDDGPRLAYADHLDDRGEPRGQFIRVQCALAGEHRKTYEVKYRRRIGKIMHGAVSLRTLPWVNQVLDDWGMGVSVDGWGYFVLPVEPHATFRRGFVEAVTCTAADWLTCADALTAATPLRKVRLTGWPEPRFEELTPGVTGPLRLRGGKRWVDFERLSQDDRLESQLLKAEWPRIEFELPVVDDRHTVSLLAAAAERAGRRTAEEVERAILHQSV